MSSSPNKVYIVAGGSQQPNLIPCMGPYTEKYISKAARIRSYEDKKNDSTKTDEVLKKMINDLSEAGFYFPRLSKHNDLVVCFYCGGGLKGWRTHDIPWVEHAAAYPKCTFIKISMTAEFINNCIAMKCESRATSLDDSNSIYVERVLKELELRKQKQKVELESEKINKDNLLCQVCNEGHREVVFLPCSHFVSCSTCAASSFQCILCERKISAFLKIYY